MFGPNFRLTCSVVSIALASCFLPSSISSKILSGSVANAAPAAKQAKKSRKRKSTRQPGVRELFAQGDALFKKRKLKQATAVFSKILTLYPDHEPTIILFAKAAYLLGHVKDAYSLFSRVRIDDLDPETSYEYGHTFYSSKNWEGALLGFKRIRARHPLSDLANYYSSICAIRLRKYTLAENKMERAVVLPEKLSKSRDVYLKHLEEIRLLHQRRMLARQKSKIKKKIRLSRRTKKKKNSIAKNDTKKIAISKMEKAPVKKDTGFKGTQGIIHKASVGTKQKRQINDMDGLVSKTSNITLSNFSLSTGAMNTFYISKGNLGAYGIRFGFGVLDFQSEGRETRILLFEDLDSLERVQTSDPELSHWISGSVSANPWVQFPIMGNKWLSFESSITFKYPDFERANRSGTRGSKVQVAGSEGHVNLLLSLSYDDILNSDTDPTTNMVKTGFRISSKLMENLNLAIDAGYTTYQYLTANAKGPDAVTSFSSTLSHSFPLNVFLSGAGMFNIISNQVSNESENYDFMSAEGFQKGAKITGSISPFGWLSIIISQLYLLTSWTDIFPDGAQDEWDLKVPNYLEELVWAVNINKSF